jgi:hypothetical protein
MRPLYPMWLNWYKIVYFVVSCMLYMDGLPVCTLFTWFRFRITKYKFERWSIGFALQDLCTLKTEKDRLIRRIRIFLIYILLSHSCTLNFVFHNETAEVSEMWVSRFSYFLLSFTKSDSLELINACNAVIEVWSPYTAIMAECFFLRQAQCQKLRFNTVQGKQMKWHIN